MPGALGCHLCVAPGQERRSQVTVSPLTERPFGSHRESVYFPGCRLPVTGARVSRLALRAGQGLAQTPAVSGPPDTSERRDRTGRRREDCHIPNIAATPLTTPLGPSPASLRTPRLGLHPAQAGPRNAHGHIAQLGVSSIREFQVGIG